MHPDDQRRYSAIIILAFPLMGWFYAAKTGNLIGNNGLAGLYELARSTPSNWTLLFGLIAGFVIGCVLAFLLHALGKNEFQGAQFKRHLRGTKIVSFSALKRRTNNAKAEQVSIAGVPVPRSVEQLHTMICGSTGSGKSVLLNELVFTALCRGDRAIVLDPNGSMYARFGRKGDKLLNPHDERTEGWSIFNEIRKDYDFDRYALSVVPRGKTADAEEWRGYARLLLAETMRKVEAGKNPTVQAVAHYTTIATPEALKAFLTGTQAESLFVGADKALASARFVLSTCLPQHLKMPKGNFSLRDWLEDEHAGNLYITWREDMAESMKPLLSAWVDVLCTSVLSLPEDPNRTLWLCIDELASLEKLPSLEDAATKGRKAGLRLVAGLQSTSQLTDIYGVNEAQTLRSCFRSTVVLSGAKSDPRTCEDMSLSLGEHEVERERHSKSRQSKGSSVSRQINHERERVVLPSEIASLPALTGYLAFAGEFPIARITLAIMKFAQVNEPFVERGSKQIDPSAAAPAGAGPLQIEHVHTPTVSIA